MSQEEQKQTRLQRYWRANVTLMAILLSVWAVSGLGLGVLWADTLSAIRLGGFPLGFWFAQQGSIIIFIILILIYCVGINRLDRKYFEDENSKGKSD